MVRRVPLFSIVVVSVFLVGLVSTLTAVRIQSQIRERKVLQMAGYAETTGIDPHIEGVKTEVLAFLKHFNSALKGKDATAALDLMADDWAYSNERGETLSPQQWVADRVSSNRGKNLIFPFLQHVDVKWHVFGDNVVVETGRSNSTLYYNGKVSHGPRRETAVYTKINGQWVQASLHVGFIPQEQRDFTFPPGALPDGITTPGPHSKPPTKRFLQMAGYQDTTGINPHIEEIRGELRETAAERSHAMKARTADALLGIMASNWAYSNERGETFGKAQWVNNVITKQFHTMFAQHVDVEWHVFGDNVVVETGRSNSTLYYKGKVSYGPRRETAVYTKIHGKWVQASLHVGLIPTQQVDFTFPAGALPH